MKTLSFLFIGMLIVCAFIAALVWEMTYAFVRAGRTAARFVKEPTYPVNKVD